MHSITFSRPHTIQADKIQTKSPAKLILSGEHSVVYGQPAISLPIPVFSHCEIEFQANNPTCIAIELKDLNQYQELTIEQFELQSQSIEKRFEAFNQGLLKIDKVLQTPFDLILISLKKFGDLITLPTGRWKIIIHSEIPFERGLGSSASIIVSLLKALEELCQTPLQESFLSLAKTIENFQHGTSSGLDPTTIYQNHALRYQHSGFRKLALGKLTSPLKAWLIDSGKSQSSTGDTVSHVKNTIGNNHGIWQQFAKVTQQIETFWLKDAAQLLTAIGHNQQLLGQIGVVPNAVQTWLSELEAQTGGAGKICGAGAIQGNSAGVVLFLSEKSPKAFCQQHQLTFFELDW